MRFQTVTNEIFVLLTTEYTSTEAEWWSNREADGLTFPEWIRIHQQHWWESCDRILSVYEIYSQYLWLQTKRQPSALINKPSLLLLIFAFLGQCVVSSVAHVSMYRTGRSVVSNDRIEYGGFPEEYRSTGSSRSCLQKENWPSQHFYRTVHPCDRMHRRCLDTSSLDVFDRCRREDIVWQLFRASAWTESDERSCSIDPSYFVETEKNLDR